MKNVEKIAETLKSVYGVLTQNISTFSNIYGYQIAEIKIKGVKIGIGIKANFTEIRFYVISGFYQHNDPRRFKETFVVKSIFLNRTWVWSMDLVRENLVASIDRFSLLSRHISAISEISIMIDEYSLNTYETKKLLK